MKRNTVLINLFTILLFVSTFSGAIETQIVKNKNIATSFVVKKAAAVDSYKSDKTKKYDSVDGSTSASQLRAKRSHSVSQKDETGLAVFFGIIVISVIIFFLKPFSDK